MIAHQDVYIFCLRGLQQHHKRKIYDANGNLIDSDNSFAYLSIIHPQKCACVDVMFENSANFNFLVTYGNTQETDEKSLLFRFPSIRGARIIMVLMRPWGLLPITLPALSAMQMP